MKLKSHNQQSTHEIDEVDEIYFASSQGGLGEKCGILILTYMCFQTFCF